MIKYNEGKTVIRGKQKHIKKNSIPLIVVRRRWYHSIFESLNPSKENSVKICEVHVEVKIYADKKGRVFLSNPF